MNPLVHHVMFGRKGRLLDDSSTIGTLIDKYGVCLGGTVRADLIELLSRPLKESLSLHYDREVVSIDTSHPDNVRAHMADGSSLTADLLIGADGINSTVAKQLFGADDPPRFSGENIFYGVIEGPSGPFDCPYLGKPNLLLQLFDQGRFVSYSLGGVDQVSRVSLTTDKAMLFVSSIPYHAAYDMPCLSLAAY